MNSRWPDYLRETTAMLNAGIRILRTEFGEEDSSNKYQSSIDLWAERVKRNMALIEGATDPENKNG
jgi:hypothetical protein